MKLSEMPIDELELLGYDDIALIILQESGKKMKLVDIFKKVCKVLEKPAECVDTQLVDFFELMSINKKFIMLKNGFWDLQSRHKADIIIEDNDDDYIEVVDDIEDDEEDENEDIFYEKDEDTDDEADDDLEDLAVVDEDEETSV
ncbi:MAG: DNA-directed RNA polymerase subunit delta [Bacilli bacterium]